MANKSRGGGVRNQRPGNTGNQSKQAVFAETQKLLGGHPEIVQRIARRYIEDGGNPQKSSAILIPDYIKEHGLTPENIIEAATLIAYTGDLYADLNKSLASGAKNNEVVNAERALSNAVKKLRPPFEGTAYRRVGIGGKSAKQFDEIFKNGTGRVEFKTALSTTNSSKSDYHPERSNTGNFYVIKSKTGKEITNFSIHSEEREVLFGPGSKFNVGGAYKNDKGQRFIELYEI